MNVRIQAVNFDAAAQLKEFIEEKVAKLKNYFDNIIDVEVYLKLDSQEQVKDKIAEVKLNVPGVTLFASETSKSFEESSVLALESLVRQLKKRKAKARG